MVVKSQVPLQLGMAACGWSETVRVAVPLALPPGPVAVSVKVIDWGDCTGILPEDETWPMPGVIITLAALETLQLSEEYEPVVTLVGLNVK